jgi:hypothetical protein
MNRCIKGTKYTSFMLLSMKRQLWTSCYLLDLRFSQRWLWLMGCFLLGLLFKPEGKDSTFIRNVSGRLPEYTALRLRTFQVTAYCKGNSRLSVKERNSTKSGQIWFYLTKCKFEIHNTERLRTAHCPRTIIKYLSEGCPKIYPWIVA